MNTIEKYIKRSILVILFWGVRSDAFNEKQVVKLTAPHCTEDDVIGYNFGMRPCRKTGIRLEAEHINDKLIIHNYGHCGMGITLSWGTAQEAINIMERECSFAATGLSSTEIAIIGCGVIGLSTAHLLLDKGYKVRIYASQLPPHTTSDRAGAFWSIGSSSFEPGFFEPLQKNSFLKFKQFATGPDQEFKGVALMNIYAFNNADPGFKGVMEELVPMPDPTIIVFNEQTIREGLRYQTIQMDMPLYMKDLFEKALQKGAFISEKTIKNIDEILQFDEEIIFNCAGLGARDLFKDDKVYPVRGQLVYLKPNKDVNYMIFGHSNSTQVPYIYMIPQQERIVIGGTFERDNGVFATCKETLDQILQNNHEFFTKH
jgi:D-amino-acid oxidase